MVGLVKHWKSKHAVSFSDLNHVPKHEPENVNHALIVEYWVDVEGKQMKYITKLSPLAAQPWHTVHYVLGKTLLKATEPIIMW